MSRIFLPTNRVWLWKWTAVSMLSLRETLNVIGG
jgi:hypothetical protein